MGAVFVSMSSVKVSKWLILSRQTVDALRKRIRISRTRQSLVKGKATFGLSLFNKLKTSL